MEVEIDEAEILVKLDTALQLAKRASENPEIVTQSYDLTMDIASVMEDASKKRKLSYGAVILSFLLSLLSFIGTLFIEISIKKGFQEQDLLH